MLYKSIYININFALYTYEIIKHFIYTYNKYIININISYHINIQICILYTKESHYILLFIFLLHILATFIIIKKRILYEGIYSGIY